MSRLTMNISETRLLVMAYNFEFMTDNAAPT